MNVSIAILASSITCLCTVYACDAKRLRDGVPTLGFIFILMYICTYGVGLTVWSFDPSSIFGYGSLSTNGGLGGMCRLFLIGITGLSTGYIFSRTIIRNSRLKLEDNSSNKLIKQMIGIKRKPEDLAFVLVILGVIGLFIMVRSGIFDRQLISSFQPDRSLIYKVMVGSSLMSRLAPVGLILLPYGWTKWNKAKRYIIVVAVITWLVLAYLTNSRGQLLSIPLYIIIGCLVSGYITIQKAISIIIVFCVLAWPLAEWIRVNRLDTLSANNDGRMIELFQTGRQMLGTSHEMYLMLRPEDCSVDLDKELKLDKSAHRLVSKDIGELSFDEKYHIARYFNNCRTRQLLMRGFEGFEKFPWGLLPNTIFATAPSLFDGQDLVERISEELKLKPGEISAGTISVFADSWWRFGWYGVMVVTLLFGLLLGIIQNVLFGLQPYFPFTALLGQLLAVTLIGSWVNNTILTMIWYLMWDFPKSLVELILLSRLLTMYSIHRNSQNGIA